MTLYKSNLYVEVIKKAAEKYNRLRIISGYGSPTFLEKVIKDFPNMKIKLFLGMTQEGLSLNSHNKYCSIVRSSKNIEVFYQCYGKLNHMKIYEFYNSNSSEIFVGSANFSENGFLKQKELLVSIQSSVEDLFIEQQKRSLECVDEKVETVISLISDDIDNKETIRESSETLPKKYTNQISEGNIKKKYIPYNELIRNKISNKYYDTFKLTIVLPSENDLHWGYTGINGGFNNKEPCLRDTTRNRFKDFFPEDLEFIIHLENKERYEARLLGNFSNELLLKEFNIYNYLKLRINLTELRPINFSDLNAFGLSVAYFTRLNKREFYMSFSGYINKLGR